MLGTLATLWPVFVLSILALGAIASFVALRNSSRYTVTETRALDYVADKLKRVRDAEESSGESGAAPSARRLVSISDLLQGLSKETIIADRLALIKRMRESQVKISVSALQQMTIAQEASRKWLSLPSFAANLSMMLGLLGTVFGLSLMVQQIDLGLPGDSSQLTMDAWMASITHIRGVLGGMKTGFSATLAGLTSAIVLSWLNYRLGRDQAIFLNKLDRFTIEDLLPSTVPTTEDESLLEKVSLQLEASFIRLDDIAQKNQDTLTQLNSIEMGFIEIFDTVRQTTKTETSDRIHELIGRFSGIIDQIVVLNHSVMNTTVSFPALLKQADETNKASLNRVDRLITVYEEQRSLIHWPLQVKVIFGCMAALNIILLAFLIFK